MLEGTDGAVACPAVMVDKENEMQRPVACKLNFAAEQKGGAPSKGLGAKRSEGKTLGVLTPSKANNVGRKRGMSMLHVAKPDLEGAKAEQKEIAKKARHSMFPEGTRAAPALLSSPDHTSHHRTPIAALAPTLAVVTNPLPEVHHGWRWIPATSSSNKGHCLQRFATTTRAGGP